MTEATTDLRIHEKVSTIIDLISRAESNQLLVTSLRSLVQLISQIRSSHLLPFSNSLSHVLVRTCKKWSHIPAMVDATVEAAGHLAVCVGIACGKNLTQPLIEQTIRRTVTTWTSPLCRGLRMLLLAAGTAVPSLLRQQFDLQLLRALYSAVLGGRSHTPAKSPELVDLVQLMRMSLIAQANAPVKPAALTPATSAIALCVSHAVPAVRAAALEALAVLNLIGGRCVVSADKGYEYTAQTDGLEQLVCAPAAPMSAPVASALPSLKRGRDEDMAMVEPSAQRSRGASPPSCPSSAPLPSSVLQTSPVSIVQSSASSLPSPPAVVPQPSASSLPSPPSVVPQPSASSLPSPPSVAPPPSASVVPTLETTPSAAQPSSDAIAEPLIVSNRAEELKPVQESEGVKDGDDDDDSASTTSSIPSIVESTAGLNEP